MADQDTSDQHATNPEAAHAAVVPPVPPLRPHPPHHREGHGGPGVEPGGDDELDAVAAGPSPTHPHEPVVPSEAHPVPTPPPAATVHPVAPASPQPARWGRVDADGTV